MLFWQEVFLKRMNNKAPSNMCKNNEKGGVGLSSRRGDLGEVGARTQFPEIAAASAKPRNDKGDGLPRRLWRLAMTPLPSRGGFGAYGNAR